MSIFRALYISRKRTLFKKINHERGIAWARHNLGMINKGIGDLDKAADEYEQALSDFHLLKYDYGISRVISLLSEIYREKGDYKEALSYLKE